MDIKILNEIAVIELSEKLDLYNAALLPRAINKLIAKNTKSVILNLKNVVYIDSSWIGVLITSMSELRKNGGALKITGLNEFTTPIFRITNSKRLFDIYTDENEAVKSFKH